MAVLLPIIKALGQFMWIIAILLLILAIAVVFGMMFFKKYPIKVVILDMKGGKVPIFSTDRAGRMKDSHGIEHYWLFFAKDKIDVPDSNFIYHGKGFPFNKSYLFLQKQNNRYVPCVTYLNSTFNIKPIDTFLERQRLALERMIRAKHDTESWLSQNKGYVIAWGAVMAVIVIAIVYFTKGKDVGLPNFGLGLAPLLAIQWNKFKNNIMKKGKEKIKISIDGKERKGMSCMSQKITNHIQ